MKMNQLWHTKSAKETVSCGRGIAKLLIPGDVLALIGDLGSGKTTFVKGLAAGLGIADMRLVKSPTFVIFHIYQADTPIYHFDLYRLETEADLDDIGFDEFLSDRNAISVVEWADRIPSISERATVTVEISVDNEKERTIRLYRGLLARNLTTNIQGE